MAKRVEITIAPGLPLLLFGLFLGLKLAGFIAWGWVWVAAPLWVPLLIVASFGLAFALSMLVLLALSGGKSRHSVRLRFCRSLKAGRLR